MFSYNDGKIHDTVELTGDFTSVLFKRIENTTQYVAPTAAVNELRRKKVTYAYKVDGQLQPARRNEYQKFVPKKSYWETTPYLRVTPETPAKILICLIPGNPGLCEYYCDVVEAIARLVPGSEVVAVSYLGYNVDRVIPQKGVIGLDEQIEHKTKFIDFILDQMPTRPGSIALLGHSVGSWITQRVATRRKDINFVGLLTPTVCDIALSHRGKQFVKAMGYLGPSSLYYSVWLLRLLPLSSSIVKRLIGLIMPPNEVENEARETSMKLARNPYVCYQIVAMAVEEMNRIRHVIEPEDIRGFWDSYYIWGCFAKDDHWVSNETRQSLIDYVKSKSNVRMDVISVSHAFCLRDSEAVAGLAAQQINQWLSIND